MSTEAEIARATRLFESGGMTRTEYLEIVGPPTSTTDKSGKERIRTLEEIRVELALAQTVEVGLYVSDSPVVPAGTYGNIKRYGGSIFEDVAYGDSIPEDSPPVVLINIEDVPAEQIVKATKLLSEEEKEELGVTESVKRKIKKEKEEKEKKEKKEKEEKEKKEKEEKEKKEKKDNGKGRK